jgi:hypothetical protein
MLPLAFLAQITDYQSSETLVGMDSIHSWIMTKLRIPSRVKSFLPDYSVQFWGTKPPHQ